jgi:GTP cyclohydrolase I
MAEEPTLAGKPCLHRVRSFAVLAKWLASSSPLPLPSPDLTAAAPCATCACATPFQVDLAAIAAGTRALLAAIGEDPEREGLLKTPERVAKAYAELTRGYRMDLADARGDAIFTDDNDGSLVLMRDIPFVSLCEHHMLPFEGHAHVAYLPSKGIIGLSKMARIVERFARRLQVQERLTAEVANCLAEATEARGVAVVIVAEHKCMSMRGVAKTNSKTTTTCFLGALKTDPAERKEFYARLEASRP